MFDCGVNYLWVAIVCGCGMAPPSNALPSGQLTCTENEHHSQTLRGVYSVNFSIHTGGGGRKVSSFMRGEAQKVCLQSGGGGGSKKFSILIFPIYQPPSP